MGETVRKLTHAEAVQICLGDVVLAKRTREAEARAALLQRIAEREPTLTERAAVARDPMGVNWSTYCGWKRRYREAGLDGLIDGRVPWPGKVTPEIREKLVAARRWDPTMDVKAIGKGVLASTGVALSGSTVKRVLRSAGLARPGGGGSARKPKPISEKHAEMPQRVDVKPGGPMSPDGSEVREAPQRLELAGMKIVEVGARQTGVLQELTTGISQAIAALPAGENDAGPDLGGRDEHGRFLPEYNERYRKGKEDLGPGFAGVATKRSTKNPERYKIAQVGYNVLERKVWALMSLPVFTTSGLEALRAPIGAWLEEVCGYPYMPETLGKMLRELKMAGISQVLWEQFSVVVIKEQQKFRSSTIPGQQKLMEWAADS